MANSSRSLRAWRSSVGVSSWEFTASVIVGGRSTRPFFGSLVSVLNPGARRPVRFRYRDTTGVRHPGQLVTVPSLVVGYLPDLPGFGSCPGRTPADTLPTSEGTVTS